jgi:hypothetical protein
MKKEKIDRPESPSSETNNTQPFSPRRSGTYEEGDTTKLSPTPLDSRLAKFQKLLDQDIIDLGRMNNFFLNLHFSYTPPSSFFFPLRTNYTVALRKLSWHGIPKEVRAICWKLLLVSSIIYFSD